MIEEKFRKGKVVFNEGDPGDCLYYIRWGSVAIYSQYKTRNQKKIAELSRGNFFGEMGLLDHERRTATVVSTDHETVLNRIVESEFDQFMSENPTKVMDILRQLSHKLRDTTKKYLELCKDVESAVGSDTETVDESKHYGFENNDNLAAVHDGQEA